MKDIKKGVSNLLSFINNISGLALVRDAVYDILQNDSTNVCHKFVLFKFLIHLFYSFGQTFILPVWLFCYYVMSYLTILTATKRII